MHPVRENHRFFVRGEYLEGKVLSANERTLTFCACVAGIHVFVETRPQASEM